MKEKPQADLPTDSSKRLVSQVKELLPHLGEGFIEVCVRACGLCVCVHLWAVCVCVCMCVYGGYDFRVIVLCNFSFEEAVVFHIIT